MAGTRFGGTPFSSGPQFGSLFQFQISLSNVDIQKPAD